MVLQVEFEIFLTIVFLILGASVGSFLNVVADRIPLGKSVVSPPSHCFKCGSELKPADLIPIFSYIVLKGRCRYCGASIPPRSLVIELVTGLLYAFAFIKLGFGWRFFTIILYGSIFIVLAVIDMEESMIPYIIVFPAIGLALLISLINPLMGEDTGIQNFLMGLALSFGFFVLVWGVPRLLKRSVINFGDVTMASLVGASAGFPLVLIALYLAILAGGLVAIVLIVLKLRRYNQPMSFGLFLALGAIVTLIWGEEMLRITMLLQGK